MDQSGSIMVLLYMGNGLTYRSNASKRWRIDFFPMGQWGDPWGFESWLRGPVCVPRTPSLVMPAWKRIFSILTPHIPQLVYRWSVLLHGVHLLPPNRSRRIPLLVPLLLVLHCPCSCSFVKANARANVKPPPHIPLHTNPIRSAPIRSNTHTHCFFNQCILNLGASAKCKRFKPLRFCEEYIWCWNWWKFPLGDADERRPTHQCPHAVTLQLSRFFILPYQVA